jgi:pimeloyl-ACP methyl ester carboxylesterase
VLEADAETIEGAIRKIGRPVHLFGHSYGGRVALEVAQRRNVQLETLILFEPVIQGALSHQPPEEFLDVSNSYEPFLRALTNYWGGDQAWDSLSASFRQQQLKKGARIHLEVTQLSRDQVTPDEWASLTIPVLIIRGDYGHQDAEQMTQALADAIPTSTLKVIPDSAHMAPIVDARTVGMVVKTWLGLR